MYTEAQREFLDANLSRIASSGGRLTFSMNFSATYLGCEYLVEPAEW
ncbi:hypothetical protein [Pseudodesulfovibrio sp.]